MEASTNVRRGHGQVKTVTRHDSTSTACHSCGQCCPSPQWLAKCCRLNVPSLDIQSTRLCGRRVSCGYKSRYRMSRSLTPVSISSPFLVVKITSSCPQTCDSASRMAHWPLKISRDRPIRAHTLARQKTSTTTRRRDQWRWKFWVSSHLSPSLIPFNVPHYVPRRRWKWNLRNVRFTSETFNVMYKGIDDSEISLLQRRWRENEFLRHWELTSTSLLRTLFAHEMSKSFSH